MASASLSSKVLSGMIWMVALRLAQRSVGVVSAVILARILAPEDYGMVAIGLLCVSFFKILSETGIQQNLVQDRNHSDDLLSTAWTIEVIRGLIIAVAVFALAPLAAAFFEEPSATVFIRVLSLMPLLNSLRSVRVVYFQRELQFQKLFIYQMGGTVGAIIIAITAALILRNAWALVISQMAGAIILLTLSYIFFPRAPKIAFHKDSLAKLYAFGKWVLPAALLSYFVMEGDKFFTGKLFGKQALGLYVMAALLPKMIVNQFGKSIAMVLFPAYAKVRDDPSRLKSSFFKAYDTMLSVLAPACLGCYLIGEDFTSVVLGDKWLDIIPVMKMLSLASLALVFCTSASGFFYGLNKPKYPLICEAVRAPAMLLLLIYLPPTFGIIGVALAVFLSSLCVFPLYIYLCCRVVSAGISEFLRIYVPLAALLAIMYVSVAYVKVILDPGPIRLILSISAGVTSYCGFALLLRRLCHFGPAENWASILLRVKSERQCAL